MLVKDVYVLFFCFQILLKGISFTFYLKINQPLADFLFWQPFLFYIFFPIIPTFHTRGFIISLIANWKMQHVFVIFAVISIFLGCVAAQSGAGTMSTNWVENKCGFDPNSPDFDQNYATIRLTYSNSVVVSGTTYTVASVTLKPAPGNPPCLYLAASGSWTALASDNQLTAALAQSPLEVNSVDISSIMNLQLMKLP